MEARPVRESASEYSELTLPNDSNGFGNVLGGKVMHLVDLAAAMAGFIRRGGACPALEGHGKPCPYY